MINENSTGLNGIPLCVNVFPINLKRKSFNSIEEGAPFNFEWNAIIKFKWIPMIYDVLRDWMESHYVSMYIQLILKGTFVNSLIYWIESPSSHQIKAKVIQFNWRGNSIRCLLKPLYQCILNGIQLINSKESQWSLIFQWDWMESHYVSM